MSDWEMGAIKGGKIWTAFDGSRAPTTDAWIDYDERAVIATYTEAGWERLGWTIDSMLSPGGSELRAFSRGDIWLYARWDDPVWRVWLGVTGDERNVQAGQVGLTMGREVIPTQVRVIERTCPAALIALRAQSRTFGGQDFEVLLARGATIRLRVFNPPSYKDITPLYIAELKRPEKAQRQRKDAAIKLNGVEFSPAQYRVYNERYLDEAAVIPSDALDAMRYALSERMSKQATNDLRAALGAEPEVLGNDGP